MQLLRDPTSMSPAGRTRALLKSEKTMMFISSGIVSGILLALAQSFGDHVRSPHTRHPWAFIPERWQAHPLGHGGLAELPCACMKAWGLGSGDRVSFHVHDCVKG